MEDWKNGRLEDWKRRVNLDLSESWIIRDSDFD